MLLPPLVTRFFALNWRHKWSRVFPTSAPWMVTEPRLADGLGGNLLFVVSVVLYFFFYFYFAYTRGTFSFMCLVETRSGRGKHTSPTNSRLSDREDLAPSTQYIPTHS